MPPVSLPPRAVALDAQLHGVEQILIAKRLGQELDRAGLHRAHASSGMSPWPVMKMIGNLDVGLGELALKVEAAQARQADVEHEAARHVGRSASRKSAADPNVRTSKPYRAQQPCNASRTDGSSSMTKTTAVLVAHAAFAQEGFDLSMLRWKQWVSAITLVNGQREAEFCAPRRAGFRPQLTVMGLDDGPANRQPHADAVVLRRIECVKQERECSGSGRGLNPARYQNGTLTVARGPMRSTLRPATGRPVHRLDRIDDQVEEHLLDLHAVGGDRSARSARKRVSTLHGCVPPRPRQRDDLDDQPR